MLKTRLFGDLLLGEDEAADSEKGAEEMNGLAGFCRTSLNGLPVDGQGFGGVCDPLGPESQGLLEVPGIDSGDRPVEAGTVALPGERKEAAESFQKILLGGEVFRPFTIRPAPSRWSTRYTVSEAIKVVKTGSIIRKQRHKFGVVARAIDSGSE